VTKTLRAVQFLFTGPLILLLLYVVGRMTDSGGDWFRWAALGIGIAWVVSLLRVVWAIILIGGLAAFIAWLAKRETRAVRD
jgi:lysylphosphatidylglycerol synthetase-like protein (DUF2156 family)